MYNGATYTMLLQIIYSKKKVTKKESKEIFCGDLYLDVV